MYIQESRQQNRKKVKFPGKSTQSFTLLRPPAQPELNCSLGLSGATLTHADDNCKKRWVVQSLPVLGKVKAFLVTLTNGLYFRTKLAGSSALLSLKETTQTHMDSKGSIRKKRVKDLFKKYFEMKGWKKSRNMLGLKKSSKYGKSESIWKKNILGQKCQFFLKY